MRFYCRSELARDGLKNAAFSQQTRVIVNDHREQARSYNFLTEQHYEPVGAFFEGAASVSLNVSEHRPDAMPPG